MEKIWLNRTWSAINREFEHIKNKIVRVQQNINCNFISKRLGHLPTKYPKWKLGTNAINENNS